MLRVDAFDPCIKVYLKFKKFLRPQDTCQQTEVSQLTNDSGYSQVDSVDTEMLRVHVFDPGLTSVFEFNKFFLPQDTCQ